MIHAKTALTFERIAHSPPPSLRDLSVEDDIDLDYVDSVVESLIFRHFNGDMFAVPVPAKFMSVMDHLKQRYKEGGWSVGVFPQRDGDVVREILLAIAPRGDTVIDGEKLSKEIPEIAQPISAFSREKKLLVRMPTRGRPAQALQVLQLYRDMAGMPIGIEVVIDENDETMNNASTLQRLNALGCVITVGGHESKVEAVNGGREQDWDVLLLASDDMVPSADGYAVEVMNAMEQHWPHLDGALYFDDGYAHERCITLPIMGRRWFEQWSYVYEPEYLSLVCDVEQTELWKAMGRVVYVDKQIIKHRHPATGTIAKDALYERNDALHSADMKVYERRKTLTQPHSQFRFGSPPLWLSVCIATVPERKAQLERLVEELYSQILFDQPRKVEVLVDNGEGTIGEKRQRLLERAKGHFVSFVDDDDWVSHDYVNRIVDALEDSPMTDCVALTGQMTVYGGTPKHFEHSIMHKEWSDANGKYFRSPNHLNPVRREFALQVGFKPMNNGEDHDYSKRLYPLLKNEVSIGDKSAYMYWFIPKRNA